MDVDLDGRAFRHVHWMYRLRLSFQEYAFAVEIVFICSVVGMYCTGCEWVLRATWLYATKI